MEESFKENKEEPLSTVEHEIVHTSLLSGNIGSLFLQEEFSDVTLVVENRKFPAHRVILACRSDYFRALLFGGLSESQKSHGEIELKEINEEGFLHLLKYIYTGRVNLKELKEEEVLEVLSLSNKYGFEKLQLAISNYLKAILSVQNVCLIFDMASMFDLDGLVSTCCDFMDSKPTKVLKSESFLTMSQSALEVLLKRDSFCAAEVEIFLAVQMWCEANQCSASQHQKILQLVRLSLMTLDDLLGVVRPSGLVSADDILDTIKAQRDAKNLDLPYRGFLIQNENVASSKHGAKVILGVQKGSLLDGDHSNYNLDQGFTMHHIDSAGKGPEGDSSSGIVVALDSPYIINNIRMLLWDKDTRAYSYYVEASVDQKKWFLLIDYRKNLCRSWQNLRFKARVMKYIRVIGTHNSVNKVFHLVSLECSFNTTPCTLNSDLIVPSTNIATVKNSACVVEGVSRSRNALINGDILTYDWDSGYTCHQLGSGAIVVQLAQPYFVSCMRLLLWDRDNRTYSYYVEVSNDQQNWTKIADRTQDRCRSWQYIFFDARPVTFVKIVGTHNSANEVFHCVHFECPISKEALLDYERAKDEKINSENKSSTPVSTTAADVTLGSSDMVSGFPFVRLQGLIVAREDAGVDHGDGYGVGFLGGGGAIAGGI